MSLSCVHQTLRLVFRSVIFLFSFPPVISSSHQRSSSSHLSLSHSHYTWSSLASSLPQFILVTFTDCLRSLTQFCLRFLSVCLLDSVFDQAFTFLILPDCHTSGNELYFLDLLWAFACLITCAQTRLHLVFLVSGVYLCRHRRRLWLFGQFIQMIFGNLLHVLEMWD